MPRGVYDRSKQKKSTEKAEKAVEKTVEKVAKGKPGRKPGTLKKYSEPVGATGIASTVSEELLQAVGALTPTRRESIFELQRAAEALVAIRNSVAVNADATAAIDQKLVKLADVIFASVLGGTVEKVQTAQVEEVKTETVPVQVAPAPVEFIPPPAPAVAAPLPFNLPPVNG